MITMTHTPVVDAAAAAERDEDYYRIPAGGRWMPMDWDRIGEAFENASRRLGWDADFELLPERQRVIVRVPAGRSDLVGDSVMEFYGIVAAELGMEPFMSIWIDILTKD
jgi:hypothetical protein